MEVGRSLLSSPPPFPARTHLKNSHSSSVLMLHELAAPAVTSSPVTSMGRHFPASVLSQEQRDEFRPFLSIFKEASQARLDGRQTESGTSSHEVINSDDLDQLVLHFERQLLQLPDFWNLVLPLQTEQHPSLSLHAQSVATDTNKLEHMEPTDVINLAKKALTASKEAVLIAESSVDIDNSVATRVASTSSSNVTTKDVIIVRSTRQLERKSKNRRVSKLKDSSLEPPNSRRNELKKKSREEFDPNDPVRLFLRGPGARQLLSAEEESELILQVQDFMRAEKVKSRLHSQFGREPTLVEWAEAIGLSSKALQLQLHSANRSRDKLINANLRLVVYVAKQYQGRGLSLQDLLQEGSIGLMKSVEKFKPLVGCKFATYAYWWVRQTVRKAIFQHSRTIRIPENMYTLLGKVMEAKRSFVRKGNRSPAKEELADHVGITIEKLEKLLFMSRMPLSMQQPVWADQDTTFQEITADTEIEIPDLSVTKQLMRQHVHGLLSILNPKERRIIRLRFGIEDGKPKSLSEIGNVFGLSKERVRQLESRALYKLKQCHGSHELDAYTNLLV